MNKSKKGALTGSDKLMGIFLIIVVALIPFICKLNVVGVSAEEYGVIRSAQSVNDIFSYCKSVFILTMGVVIAIFMAFQILGEDGFSIDFKSKPVIMAGVLLLLSLISCIFSSEKHTAFFGVSERYEGFFVWVCYMVFMIVAMAFSSDRKRLDFMLWGFVLSAVLLGAVGIMQFFGYNIFSAEWFSKLIMGSKYSGTPLKIRFDSVFATLYNPNCAGMYFGMMFSFFAASAALMPLKSKLKWLFAVLAVILCVCVIGSDSVGGLMGVIFGIGFSAVLCIVYYIFALKSKKAAVISLCAIAAAAVGLVVLLSSNAVVVQKINIIYNAVKNGEGLDQTASFYEDVRIDGMKGIIVTKDGEFAVDCTGEVPRFMHNGRVLEPMEENTAENGTGYVYDESGVKWTMLIANDDNMPYVNIKGADAQGTETSFIFGEYEGKLTFMDKFRDPVDISVPAESWGFEGIERLGSNRGYIWSRSIPLLKRNIIIGAGADNFVFEFPQDDVISKLRFLGNPYVIVDKPHNMFLQTGINTGVLSLVVMLSLFALYFVTTVKAVMRGGDQSLNALRFAFLAGITAYIAAGLTTDSVVSVAPVFWTMLGAGFGANAIGGRGE